MVAGNPLRVRVGDPGSASTPRDDASGRTTPRQAPTTRLPSCTTAVSRGPVDVSAHASCRRISRGIYAHCTTTSIPSTHTPSPMPTSCTSRRRSASPPTARRDRRAREIVDDGRRPPTGGCHAQHGPFRWGLSRPATSGRLPISGPASSDQNDHRGARRPGEVSPAPWLAPSCSVKGTTQAAPRPVRRGWPVWRSLQPSAHHITTGRRHPARPRRPVPPYANGADSHRSS
jgi:hypothetical protein